MAIRLEGSTRRFTGLSTDTRPFVGVQQDGTTLTGRDLPVGSSLLLLDTWEIERWDGEQWRKERPPADLAAKLDELVAEQKRTNEMLFHLLSKF